MLDKFTPIICIALALSMTFAYKMDSLLDPETGEIRPEAQEAYNNRQGRFFIRITKVRIVLFMYVVCIDPL